MRTGCRAELQVKVLLQRMSSRVPKTARTRCDAATKKAPRRESKFRSKPNCG